jgi:hypothetical protein
VYEMPFPNLLIDQIVESASKYFPLSLPSHDPLLSPTAPSLSSPLHEFLTSPEGRGSGSGSVSEVNRTLPGEGEQLAAHVYRQLRASYQDHSLRPMVAPLFSQVNEPQAPTTPTAERFPLPLASLLSISEEDKWEGREPFPRDES